MVTSVVMGTDDGGTGKRRNPMGDGFAPVHRITQVKKQMAAALPRNAAFESADRIKMMRAHSDRVIPRGAAVEAVEQAKRALTRNAAFESAESIETLREAVRPRLADYAVLPGTAEQLRRDVLPHLGSGAMIQPARTGHGMYRSLSEAEMARQEYLATAFEEAEREVIAQELKVADAVSAKEEAEEKYEALRRENEARPTADAAEKEKAAEARLHQAREHEHQEKLAAANHERTLEVARVAAELNAKYNHELEKVRGSNALKTTLITAGVALVVAILSVLATLWATSSAHR